MSIKYAFRLLSAVLAGCCAMPALTAAEKSPAKPRTVVIKDRRSEEMDYKLLPLGVIEYEAVDKTCRPWLSPGGLLIYEENKASVLVYDVPAVIKKISDFLRESDQNAPNIRIDFEYSDAGQENVSYVKVKPQNDGDVKKWNDSNVKAKMKNKAEQRFTGQFIVTRSGLPASIWTGQSQIDPSWLEFMRRNPGKTVVIQNGKPVFNMKYAGSPQMTTVGAGLYVRPLWNNDGTIDVEIYPEIRYKDKKGFRKNIKVVQLSSRVRIKEGQKMLIGGIISSNSETFNSIFGPEFLKHSEIQRISNMYLTAQRASDNSRRFSSIARESENYPLKPMPQKPREVTP